MNLFDNDYQIMTNDIRDHFGFDFVSLAFVQSEEDDFVLTWQFASGNLNNRYKRVILRSGKGIAGIVFKTGKSLLLTTVSEEIMLDDLYDYPIVIFERLRSLGALPLYHEDRVLGVLLAGYREEDQMTKEKFRQLHQSFNGRFGSFIVKEMEI